MKMFIRFSMVSLTVMFSISVLMAQSGTRDVVYFKNGSVIKGTILEMVLDKSIKIQTRDGSIFVYPMSEVERISKEPAPSNELLTSSERSIQGSGSSFVIYGGGAIPLGDFAKEIDVKTFQGDPTNLGFAKIGWLAGAQFVSGGSIGFLIDASYSSNPTNIDKMISDEVGTVPPSYKVDHTVGSMEFNSPSRRSKDWNIKSYRR